jgi:hypothetical protein
MVMYEEAAESIWLPGSSTLGFLRVYVFAGLFFYQSGTTFRNG